MNTFVYNPSFEVDEELSQEKLKEYLNIFVKIAEFEFRNFKYKIVQQDIKCVPNPYHSGYVCQVFVNVDYGADDE